jgi:hypothetical protein
MLINLSNHPYEKWDETQKQAAIEAFGRVEDYPFPPIDPTASSAEVLELAHEYARECKMRFYFADIPVGQVAENHAVHVQGEFTFTFQVVLLLKAEGVRCVASTSHRKTVDLGNGKKKLQFSFEQFREY